MAEFSYGDPWVQQWIAQNTAQGPNDKYFDDYFGLQVDAKKAWDEKRLQEAQAGGEQMVPQAVKDYYANFSNQQAINNGFAYVDPATGAEWIARGADGGAYNPLSYGENAGISGYKVNTEGRNVGTENTTDAYYDQNGLFTHNYKNEELKSSEMFLAAVAAALTMGVALPAMGAAGGAAGTGGAAAGGAAGGAGLGTGSGAFLGEGVASGIGAWDAAAGMGAVGGAGGAGAGVAAGSGGGGLGTGSGAFLGEGVASGIPAWDSAAGLGGLGGAGAGGAGGAGSLSGVPPPANPYAAGAGGLGGAGGSGGGISGMLGEYGSMLGPLATAAGGLLGAQGQSAENSSTRAMDPRMDSLFYGDLAPRTQGLLNSQMPQAQAVSNQLLTQGSSMLGQSAPTTATNPYLKGIADDMQRRTGELLGANNLAIQGNAVGVGGLGGSRQGVAQGIGAGRAADSLQGNVAGLYGNAYNQDQNRHLQQQTLGAGLLSQGLQAPWAPIQNTSQTYSPFTGFGTTTNQQQSGGGWQGAIGGALGAAQFGKNAGWW